MNFNEAFEKLMFGEKIRRKKWEPLMHMSIIDGNLKTFRGENTNFYCDASVLLSDGWMVVDGKEEKLTFPEALDHMRQKKSIRHKDWVNEQFIFVDKDNIAMCKAVEYVFMPSYTCLCAQDWEIMR